MTNKQNPSDKLISLEQELLGYSVDQMTELKQRIESFGHEMINEALKIFSEKPAHYNANPKALQLILSRFVKEKISNTFTSEEMIVEFAIQRACITLQMMETFSKQQKLNKNERN